MRIVAVLFGTVTVIGAIVEIFAAAFVLTFCDENCDPHSVSTSTVSLVMGAAIIVAITAVLFVVSIAFSSIRYAAVSLLVHLIAAASLLAVWLHESHHSDGRLLIYTVAFESFAVGALILSKYEAHPPNGSRLRSPSTSS